MKKTQTAIIAEIVQLEIDEVIILRMLENKKRMVITQLEYDLILVREQIARLERKLGV